MTTAPTLAAEELAEHHGVAMSRETLRKWLIEAKLWRARYGELLQWDTSELDWLKGRGEKLYLIGMIDDATSPGWFGGPALTICEQLQVGRCEWVRRCFYLPESGQAHRSCAKAA
jgi:hypothetical protein